jgi:RimJ/RimL family protein N-acetyltransferase
MKSIKLRSWRPSDLDPYAAMNADEEVMQYFPALMTREESEASMKRAQEHIGEHGWGIWVVDVDGEFAGFTGLKTPRFEAAFTPCVEIASRLARKFWGKGIAFEAAQSALVFGFNGLGLMEIVAFTAVPNTPSRRLMESLGFVRDPDGDFDHPLIPEGHPLRRHVLYRKRR